MVDNSQEYRLKYWATRSSVRSFARSVHSFACSALLASLARSLVRSLNSLARGKVNDWMAIYSVFFSFLAHSVLLRRAWSYVLRKEVARWRLSSSFSPSSMISSAVLTYFPLFNPIEKWKKGKKSILTLLRGIYQIYLVMIRSEDIRFFYSRHSRPTKIHHFVL